MFKSAQEAAKPRTILLGTRTANSSSVVIPVQALPDHYSLNQLYSDLVAPNAEDQKLLVLVVLEQCLQHPDRVNREAADPQYAQKILTWLSVAIKPVGDLLTRDNDPAKETVTDTLKALEHLTLTSGIAFRCMRYLQEHFISQGKQVDPDILLSIVAYTDAEDPWTQRTVQEAAEQVLSYHQKQLISHEFIIEHVLLGYIRPLFSDSQPTSVTSQGRKALTHMVQKPRHLRDLDASKKPWKFREVSAMAVLRWAIRNMDESMMNKNWHLCIPPLLTLLDDPTTVIRVRGLHILQDLLCRIPPKVLQQAGLGEVFEDAVMPTLLFLPTITPVEESLNLLSSAYLALFSLGYVRYQSKVGRGNELKFLDRVMRQGVLQGFIHSGDNVRIAELLVNEVTTIFSNMGIHAVKYLKDVIPILSGILTDPFGPSHPSLLLAAVKAVQATIVSCWPRMTEPIHRIELIKALALCWSASKTDITSNSEANNLVLEGIKQELQKAGMTLVTVVRGKLDIMEELRPLIQVDPSLKSLFGLDPTLD